MNLKLERPLVFFDLETTGLEIGKDRIIEIYMMKVHPDSSVEEYKKRVNPDGVPISSGAYEKHGISIEDLKDEPTFQMLASEVHEFVKDCDLAGYNIIKFDIPFLIDELLRCGIYYNPRGMNVLDSYVILIKNEPRTLEGMYKYYTGKTLQEAHKAEADINATIEILEKQLIKYNLPEEIKTISDGIKPDSENVDLAGKLKKDKDGKIVFTFGKHANKSVVDVYKSDAGYFDWIINKSEMPRETKFVFKKILDRLKA